MSKKISYFDFAEKVLMERGNISMTYQEIWDRGKELGLDKQLLGAIGKTPHYSLASKLYTNSLKEESKFLRIGSDPVRFRLEGEQEAPAPEHSERPGLVWYKESDLHPILAHFAYANPGFGRGKKVRTKTIRHQHGTGRKGFSEWTFPDMVGVWLPNSDWNQALVEFGKEISGDLPRLFSFELKKEIAPGNYREAFFQAVSNSSWANEGYLAAATIKDDGRLLAELRRLSASFGVGIIRLDAGAPAASEILFPATTKDRLDWETMHKLCEESDDFAEFLSRVKADFQSGLDTATAYDAVEDDIDAWLEERRKKRESEKEGKQKNKKA